jgi:hypothetical protein
MPPRRSNLFALVTPDIMQHEGAPHTIWQGMDSLAQQHASQARRLYPMVLNHCGVTDYPASLAVLHQEDIDGDAINPCRQSGRAAELLELAECSQERFLRQVLSILRAMQYLAAKAINSIAVGAEDFRAGVLFPCYGPSNQLHLSIHFTVRETFPKYPRLPVI